MGFQVWSLRCAARFGMRQYIPLVICTRRGGVSLVEAGQRGRGWAVCFEGS